MVATDIDTRNLQRLELPNLEVLEHNILEDRLEALGPGSFDLVCSRLALFHLVGRQEEAIGQMTKCLRPGGWLMDKAVGQKLPALFERSGFQEIRHEATTEVVRGGSPWARWWTVTLEVINELGAATVRSARGGGDDHRARRSQCVAPEGVLHACWGRRVGDTP